MDVVCAENRLSSGGFFVCNERVGEKTKADGWYNPGNIIKGVILLSEQMVMYTRASVGFMTGECVWKETGGSTFKCALLSSSYTPSQDNDEFWSAISSYEVSSGDGYTTGGKTLVLSDPSVVTASNKTILDAADVQWTELTKTARYAVVYRDSGTASTSRLISYVDFGENKVASNGTLSITWGADGIFKTTTSAPA